MQSNNYLKHLNSDGSYFDIQTIAEEYQVNINTLPYSIRILLENILRKSTQQDLQKNIQKILHWKDNQGQPIAFYPARILLQDYTGVPCVVDLASMRDAANKLGLDPLAINPEIPVDLVIDHSVQVDQAGAPEALAYNIKKEFQRNRERYQLLKWAQQSFDHFNVIPPDTGIIHQINLEYLSPVIQKSTEKIYYPDSVFGTDSHTTMINGLGVLGWGVGGIEAEACMLGEPSIFGIPEVVGVKLVGTLPTGTVATDIALQITSLLREKNVVGKFVEYFGPGYQKLTLADRATIANMAPEYGSTCGYFPIDQQTLDYLALTNRDSQNIATIKDYLQKNNLFYHQDAEMTVVYSDVIEINLATITSNLSGPKRPQDLVALENVASSFEKAIATPLGNQGFGGTTENLKDTMNVKLNKEESLNTGDLLIAAITSCTNTSNPEVLIGAGLLAKKAVENGLTISDKVKTSLAPGSKAVTSYLDAAGLLPYLNQLGFQTIAYGCTTCIGNVGPLDPAVEEALVDSGIVAGAILSGNRNFESRIHPLIKANYLASPMLVIAYALAGNLRINLQKDPLGINQNGEKIFLSDIWPTAEEINALTKQFVTSSIYQEAYQQIFEGSEEWRQLTIPESTNFKWHEDSTYIANPPYFDEQISHQTAIPKLTNLRVLANLGDSITTDHISPAGAIGINTPAGLYLKSKGVKPKDFNSYGALRGNHHVMVRGTLANPRLNNSLADGKLGGYTKYFPTNEIMPIFDASMNYLANNTPLMILAGKDYGMGSSRDWAAKGVKLLGVKVIIAESFERIHRSNLVMMGLVPLQFKTGENAMTLGLTGEEIMSVHLPDNFEPNQTISVTATALDGSIVQFETILRYDTKSEVDYYNHGGILNSVLQEKISNQ